jgi:hypothetical protein
MHELPKNYAVIGLLVFTLAGLPVVAAEQPPANLDKTTMTAIEFVLTEDHLEQFGFVLPLQKIVETVSNNLAEWQYPVKLSGSAYSHKLEATLGKIANQATPVGFSFSSGNSDPRASGFQKADVLPISCRLSDIASGKVLVKMESTFSAHQFGHESGLGKITDKLIDQIGTVCLDVLEKVLTSKAENRHKTTLFSPKWMPDVRVEVREVPAKIDANGLAQPAAVTDEPKKEIIIHNQGTPMTFQFGHERR